jgi:hypothetical protein
MAVHGMLAAQRIPQTLSLDQIADILMGNGSLVHPATEAFLRNAYQAGTPVDLRDLPVSIDRLPPPRAV